MKRNEKGQFSTDTKKDFRIRVTKEEKNMIEELRKKQGIDHYVGKGNCENCEEGCDALYYYAEDGFAVCCICSLAQEDRRCEECEKR